MEKLAKIDKVSVPLSPHGGLTPSEYGGEGPFCEKASRKTHQTLTAKGAIFGGGMAVKV
jgi:hypothetical protein